MLSTGHLVVVISPVVSPPVVVPGAVVLGVGVVAPPVGPAHSPPPPLAAN